ncbi:MAG: DUF2071 domain-containing protein [Polyangiaceae bacterium]
MTPSRRHDRALARAFVAMFVVHAVAMLAMPLVLARFLPGGAASSEEARIAAIAASPWSFRVGWMPWQLTAVIDLLFAWLVARTPWLPRALRWLSFGVTLAAVVPDQLGQALYVTEGIARAQRVAAGVDTVAGFRAWEDGVFRLTAGWGATLYTIGTVLFLEAFRRARVWSRPLGVATALFYLTMPAAVVAPLVALLGVEVPPKLVVALNAVGFVVLLVVYALVAEAALRRMIPDEPHGRWAPWRYPTRGWFGRALEGLMNSRFAFAFTEPLPVFALASDIEDVVYVNWLVDADRLEALVPEGLTLDRLGPRRDRAIFSVLTYQHGHFGFRFLGPLRRFSPSAVQTNWRIHVREPSTGRAGIYFVTNAISFLPQAAGARLFTEGMPMHVLHRAEVGRHDREVSVAIDGGAGSAPDLRATFELVGEGGADANDAFFPEHLREVFPTYREFLAYIVPQNRAMATQPHAHTFTRQEIHLPIEPDQCVPLRPTSAIVSRAAGAIVGDARPFAFWVGEVAFTFSEELRESLPRSAVVE